ncbi:MAG: steryl acetyl hydrolase [Sphingobacteriales bacterium]|nr:MAG: steryl acetyl hydrolase [Sphingobacteriales bacterium]
MKQHILIAALGITAASFAACNNEGSTKTETTDSTTVVKEDNNKLKPAGPKPDYAPDMHDEMAVVMEKLGSYSAPPLETLTPAEARKQPTPTTAVMDVIKEKNISVPAPKVDTMGKDIPVKGGTIHARIYTPQGGDAVKPVVVYYHGGGWVIADLNTYDASAAALAEQTGAIVVSVHYRQAPENKFPTAHNDAFAAYEWVLKNAASMNGDPARVAVAGESAGGNLACNVSIMARDKGIMVPLHQVLVYPVANSDTNTASYQKYATAKPLNKPMMLWFMKHILPSMSMSKDPRLVLVGANLKGLPPTTIITAQIDPLHDDGQMLADKLKEAGVDVDYKNYDGVTHEFFGMAAVVPEAKDAQGMAASNLKKALKK